MTLNRRTLKALIMGAAGLGLAASSATAQEYPFRDITTAVVWGAGGGTDTINRMIMAEMEEFLPVSINVINQTGGVAGSNGMVYVSNQPDDGYTLVGLSESNVTAAVQGGWDQRFDYWYPFIVGGSPDLVSVPADSPYETIEDLVSAAQGAPGTIPGAASGAGSIHHLNLLALQNGADAEFLFIPYQGSAPGQEAAIAGEVEFVVTSLAEQAPLIEGGQLRPLAMLTPDSAEIAGMTVPSAFDMYEGLDQYLPLMQAIGFAVHSSAPDDVKDVLGEAFSQAMQSETVATWAEANNYAISGAFGEEAQAIFTTLESNFAYTLQELGAATVDPSSLGIEAP
ncbi:MAG: tripartite tricarboxylate transporter substrate binding protein [Pseudomonadota bacterium]